MDNKNFIIYVPDRPLKNGIIGLWKEIFREMLDSRSLTWYFFLRDFKGSYGQSLLGIGWAFLVPFATLLTFIIMQASNILNVGDIGAIPYPIYALLGMSFWQLFVTCLGRGTTSLTSAGSMIKKLNFPREPLVFASLGVGLIPFLLQIGVVLFLIIFSGFIWPGQAVIPHWQIFLLPLFLIPILLLSCGFSFLLSIINVIMRDVGRAIPLGLTFLLFITPIGYTTSETSVIGTLARYNPLFYLCVGPRDMILTGSTDFTLGFVLSFALSVFIFFFCWMAFHLAKDKVPERL
ncbi:MAG: ABC transporter permease [Candidatus Hodarchaeota archaeon]